jgi:6-phosphogluconolactonase
MPLVHTYQDSTAWKKEAAQEILRDLSKEDSPVLALSGGTTPIPIYEELAATHFSWGNCTILEVDERFISAERSDSNQHLMSEHFLRIIRGKKPLFLPFDTSGNIPWQEAAEEYGFTLQGYYGKVDVAVMGIGPDGHIASLFPKGPELQEETALATTSETNVFHVWKRLTMTFPMILSSKKIVVLLKGKEKKEALDTLLNKDIPPEEFPAKRLLENQNLHIFYLES